MQSEYVKCGFILFICLPKQFFTKYETIIYVWMTEWMEITLIFFILAFLNYIQNQHTKPLLKWKHFVLVWADLLKQFLDNTLPNVVIKMNIESTGAQSDKTVIVCFRLLH